MPLPDLDPTHDARRLFGDILAYIDEANALVAARDTVTLAGLDTAVDALCRRIAALDADVAKTYADDLDLLMQRIVAMQGNMMALQAEVAASLNGLGRQQKASHAYSKAPSGRAEE
ncbi:MAG: hypothetical protein SFW64_07735 [Alphaproteobacteria bacterium]|nr:hypothetical protein [Alphaproteobacteria bacterium]